MKQKSKRYAILHHLMLFAFKRFYRRVEVYGTKDIPQSGPVIFTMNHSNAVIDPVLVAMFHKRQPGFLTRSDVFRNPLLNRLFRSFKMLPVYRQRDGVNTIEANAPVFRAVTAFLKEGGAVVIAPEGEKGIDHHLLPLKKGTARIAIQFMQECDWKTPLYICPVGLSFSEYFRVYSDVVVRYGEPILINDFHEAYEKNPEDIYRLITGRIAESLKTLMWNVDIEAELSCFYKLKRLDGVKPLFSQRLDWAMQKLGEIRHFSEAKKNRLNKCFALYLKQLDRRNLHDRHVAALARNGRRKAALAAIFSSLLILPDLLVNGIPRFLPFAIVRALHMHPHFHSSLLFGLQVLLFPLYYLLFFVLIWSVSGFLFAALLFPLAGPFLSRFYHWWNEQRHRMLVPPSLLRKREHLFSALSPGADQ